MSQELDLLRVKTQYESQVMRHSRVIGIGIQGDCICIMLLPHGNVEETEATIRAMFPPNVPIKFERNCSPIRLH